MDPAMHRGGAQAGETAAGEGDPERGLAGGGEALAQRHAAQGSRHRFGEGSRCEYYNCLTLQYGAGVAIAARANPLCNLIVLLASWVVYGAWYGYIHVAPVTWPPHPCPLPRI